MERALSGGTTPGIIYLGYIIMRLLSQSARWVINKQLAHTIGLDSALLLSELSDQYEYWQKKDQLIECDWDLYFYASGEKLKENTWLSIKKQRVAVQKLIQIGFIKSRLMWVPATLHYSLIHTIIEEKLKSQLVQNGQTRCAKKAQLVRSKRTNKLYPKGTTSSAKKAQQIIIDTNKTNNIVSKDTISEPSSLNGDGADDFIPRQDEIIQAPPPTPSPRGGDPEINRCLAIIASFNDGALDGAKDKQRQFAKHLIKKIKALPKVASGEFTRSATLEMLLSAVSRNEFHRHKIGGPQSIHRHFGTLLQIAKGEIAQKQQSRVVDLSAYVI